MQIARTIDETRAAVAAARQAGRQVGLVPTMGALHAGHYSLIERSAAECGFTVVSIFVNPTQFGPGEDLDGYPRTWEADRAGCARAGADLVFMPSADLMYPQEQMAWVTVERLTEGLCGAARPGHFRGVTTVVAKLFNIVQPERAYFGQKDAQQLAVIRRMVQDLNMPVAVVGCPTVREPDGLAMSSRNAYLNAEERQRAVCLVQALEAGRALIASGQRDAAAVRAAMAATVEATPGAQIDYISIVDKDLLLPVAEIDRPVLLALAVRVGPARLIDNIVVDPPLGKG